MILRTIAIALMALLAAKAGAQTNRVVRFDGNGDLITVPSAPDLVPASEITIEAWIYPQYNANNPSPSFLSKGDGQNVSSSRSYEIGLDLSGQYGSGPRVQVSLFVGSDIWALHEAVVRYGEWTHVAVTYRSTPGLYQLFLNGQLAASTTNDASGTIPLAGKQLRQTTLPLVFGAYPPYPGTFATGMMDEISIWNVARAGSDIYRDLYRHLSGAESNLVAYWNFEDGTASDVTGHGHNGSFTGDTTTVSDNGPITERLQVSIAVASIQLSWPSHTNMMYQVQYSSSATTNTWVNYGPAVEGIEGYSTVVDSVLGHPQGIYRVVHLP